MKLEFTRTAFLIAVLIIVAPLLASCTGSDSRILSIGEGIAHFSFEYPSDYSVIRVDIRNEDGNQYTDIGLRAHEPKYGSSFNEISVYAWPAQTQSATTILENMLSQAMDIFDDFSITDKYGAMVGDIEGQMAVFSWTVKPDNEDADESNDIQATSWMVCFYQDGLAWEIHLASGSDDSGYPQDDFRQILDTFQVLN